MPTKDTSYATRTKQLRARILYVSPIRGYTCL